MIHEDIAYIVYAYCYTHTHTHTHTYTITNTYTNTHAEPEHFPGRQVGEGGGSETLICKSRHNSGVQSQRTESTNTKTEGKY
jgi:hypothetical protein